MYSQYSKCFWERYNYVWPFRREPSSDHAVPTAAISSTQEKDFEDGSGFAGGRQMISSSWAATNILQVKTQTVEAQLCFVRAS